VGTTGENSEDSIRGHTQGRFSSRDGKRVGVVTSGLGAGGTSSKKGKWEQGTRGVHR